MALATRNFKYCQVPPQSGMYGDNCPRPEKTAHRSNLQQLNGFSQLAASSASVKISMAFQNHPCRAV